MPGYFSGPRVSTFKVGKGRGDWGRSAAMGQAIGDQESAAAKWSVTGGATGMQPLQPGTRFKAREAGDARMAAELEQIQNDPSLSLENKMNAGWNLRHGRQMGHMTGWGDFFDMLYGKGVNLSGFGFNKQLDVPSGRTYSVDAGEVAPGMRGGGGWYTQDEWRDLTPQDRQNVMGWTQARQALLRRAR